MAGGTTPPDDATRFVETTRGILSYSQLAPLLAERVRQTQAEIQLGHFDSLPIDSDLLLLLHRKIAGDLVPDWAGQWHRIEVAVREHTPPSFVKVPLLVKDYFADLAARIEHLASARDLIPEAMAFAEGRLLSIHPFQDFNGRVTRLILRELLRRLRLPPVELTPSESDKANYLAALAAADQSDWTLLSEVWRRRFENIQSWQG